MFADIASQMMQGVLAAADPATTPAPATGTSATPFNPVQFLLLFAPMLVVMWLFMFRPNSKREKERQSMLAGLSKGDKVVTSSGIIGNVIGVSEKTVVLRVSEEPIVKIEFVKSSVSRVVPRDDKEK